MSSAQGSDTGSKPSGRRVRFAAIGVILVSLALVVASCSSDDSATNDSTTTTSGGQASGSTATATTATGPEAAVAAYLQTRGHRYAGECTTASLPQDRGAWCFSLVQGGDDERVYEVGPVGEDPALLLTLDRDGEATLNPGLAVDVDNGTVGTPRRLTLEQLQANTFITSNLLLDLAAGLGKGLADLPGFGETTTTGAGAPGGDAAGGNQVVGDITVLSDAAAQQGAAQYPPPPPDITVDDPTVRVGGIVAYRGLACAPNETLTVFLDDRSIGTVSADGQGAFLGALTPPAGTPSGQHTITVRGAQCELSVTVNVLGLAYTGASNDTSTIVLVGAVVLAVGLVLVVGARRRRTRSAAAR